MPDLVLPQPPAMDMGAHGLAHSLPRTAFQTISWREGSNETLSERFAAVRERHAGGSSGKARLRLEQ